MPIPTQNQAQASLDKAEKIAHDQNWSPSVWRYPPISRDDAVWDALGPARERVEHQTGEKIEKKPDTGPSHWLAGVRGPLLQEELSVKPANKTGRIKLFSSALEGVAAPM